MSDPMTNTEIEDVLSSIRRLVSEELRPHSRSVVSDAAQPLTGGQTSSCVTQMLPGQAGKLLLTPALRVVTGDGRAESPAATEDDLGTGPVTGAEAGVSVLAEPLDHAPGGMPWPGQGDRALPLSEGAGSAPFTLGSGAAMRQDAPDVQQVVSRLGAAVAGDEEWESPVGDLEDFGDAVAPAPGFGRPEPLGTRLHLSQPASRDTDFLDPAEDAGGAGGRVETGDDFLFARQDFGPDFAPAAPPEPQPRTLRRAVPPTVDTWADAAEAEVRAELERGAEREAAEAAHALPEVAFDEEVLRDLVRDIIREELAGSLGERITRNVRKLVRSEIARAHAVRDFE